MRHVSTKSELDELIAGAVSGTTSCLVDYAVSAEGITQSFPLMIIKGAKPGPTGVFVAGIHGDEYEGPAALWDLVSTLDAESLAGHVLVVPIANGPAFAAGQRTSPIDGENLARIFPGNPEGTISHRLAAALMEMVISRGSFLIDSHSGGVRLAFIPVAGFYDDASIAPDVAKRSIELAKAMGIAWLWQLPPVPGVLSYEAAKRGIPVCGAEIGGRGNCLRSDRASYFAAYLSVLAFNGMIDSTYQRKATTACLEGDWSRSRCAGYLESFVEPGAQVKAGTLLAQLLNPFGEVVEKIHAPFEGRVLGVRHLNSVQPGDLTLCVARETTR